MDSIIIVDYTRGYDRVWIFGDMFVKNHLNKIFEDQLTIERKADYIKTHYDISSYFNHPALAVGAENILLRLRNCLIQAINAEILLPKAIIIILDDNLLDAIDHFDYGITITLGKLTEWITNQMHTIITTHKEKLPSKS